jgi:cytochrome c oxidase subunit 2
MFILADYPIKGQLHFQDPASDMLLGIYDLHDRIMFYLIILLVLVLWFLASGLTNKNYTLFSHGNLIEFLWTLTPAAILWGIGLPSLKLLYMMDEILDSEITIKAIGNQWYWNYEYSDYVDQINFSSFMLDDSSLSLGDLRLLSTDTSLVLPIQTSVRVLVTSADVIHSFAIPSLGLKIDALPGRLNSGGFILTRESIYHGQCSELCGVLHGFMPITLEGVSLSSYLNFLSNSLNS